MARCAAWAAGSTFRFEELPVATAINPTSTASSTANAATSTGVARASIAQNFDTFLQLLTTQLKNQNPLEPLDSNQFTQQLVQFAQVEQQINMNTSLGTLVSLQQSGQTPAAMSFLGATAVVEGSTTQLQAGSAGWAFSLAKPAAATITVQDASGNAVYAETRSLGAGPQTFAWNGRNSNGALQPDGSYKISVVAKDASGQSVGVSTLIEGTVDGVDLSVSPPLLSIGGQSFTLDKIRQVRRAGI
jgi:flagellar basal-body rod modification protein FlgD